MGKLIIIEGTDGSGKQTQTELLYKKLCEIKGEENIKKLSFPNYESKASEPVKMYLAGEFGKNIDSVNAYEASLFFYLDIYASYKKDWEYFYKNGGIIISDRYTTSNMVHQSPKINNEKERKKYLEWLTDLEWDKIGLPKPDMVFFLDVPFEFSQKLIKERNNKITGEEKKDIHESDKEYLKNAYDLSKEPAKEYNWVIISCVKDDKLKSIEEINNEIMEKILYNI